MYTYEPMVKNSDRIIHMKTFHYVYVFGQHKILVTIICAFFCKISVKFRLSPVNFTLVLAKFVLLSELINKKVQNVQKIEYIINKNVKCLCCFNMRL